MEKIIVILLVLVGYSAICQNEKPTETEYIEKTFYTNRIINGHSVENIAAGKLNFLLAHRMGRVDDGFKTLFGLRQATSQINLEYGISDRFNVGIATSTFQELYFGDVKFKLFRQSTGAKTFPVTISLHSTMYINTGDLNFPNDQEYFSSRLYYTHQILIARKFNEKLSLQLTPTVVHRNMVKTAEDKNQVYACGFGGRYKFTKKIALTCEYYYVLPNQIVSKINNEKVSNSFSIGVDIFTGKHVFQIFATNSVAMDEKNFITENIEKWDKKQVHIGFNISRLFRMRK